MNYRFPPTPPPPPPPPNNNVTYHIPFMKPIQGISYFIRIFNGETKAMSVWSPVLGSLRYEKAHLIHVLAVTKKTLDNHTQLMK